MENKTEVKQENLKLNMKLCGYTIYINMKFKQTNAKEVKAWKRKSPKTI